MKNNKTDNNIEERVNILYNWLPKKEKERILKLALKDYIVKYDKLTLKEKIEMEREYCKEEIKNGEVSEFTKFFYPDLIPEKPKYEPEFLFSPAEN